MSNDSSRRSAGANADRDRILNQPLRRELRADAPPVTHQCLDAETLAAWEDGGLDAAAMEAAEIHVSTCARCQSMLGALAKGAPASVPVAESKSVFSWHWWFAPLAAGAAAVTLWMVVPEEQQQLATAPPAVAAPAGEAARSQPAEPEAASQRPAQNAVLADKAQDTRVPAPTASPGAREDRRERETTASEKKEEAGKVLAEQPATAADAAAPARSAENAPFAPSAPAPAALQMRSRSSVATVEIASADGLRRWRVVATGVEYSMDRGTTWIPVRAVGTEIITGGVAVSGSICWLIGKAGVVLVTVDGMTFAKVDLPVRGDVASITATDARSAVATTADGRSFRTEDSGRNWRQN